MEVAHLTHALRIKRFIQVLALMGSLSLSNLVIAVAAHIFGNFNAIFVRANIGFWCLCLNFLFSLVDLFDLLLFYQANHVLDNLDKHNFLFFLAV